MPKRHRYTGILNKPMNIDLSPRNALRWGDPPDWERASESLNEQFKERFKALSIDCGINLYDDTDWRTKVAAGEPWHTIAMVLLQRHVPGFSVLTAKARSKKAERSFDDLRLLREMMKLTMGKGHSIRRAADILADQWNRKRDGKKEVTKHGLDSRYRRLRGGRN